MFGRYLVGGRQITRTYIKPRLWTRFFYYRRDFCKRIIFPDIDTIKAALITQIAAKNE